MPLAAYRNLTVHFLALVLVLAGMVGFYAFLPGHGHKPANAIEVKARVLTVDNTDVRSSGLSNIGHQELTVTILEGEYKGKILPATNSLVGQTDLENLYRPEDVIIAAIILENGAISHVKAVDLFRQDALLALFGLFVGALLLYAGVVGIKALISFNIIRLRMRSPLCRVKAPIDSQTIHCYLLRTIIHKETIRKEAPYARCRNSIARNGGRPEGKSVSYYPSAVGDLKGAC
jgi:hypothetical protein